MIWESIPVMTTLDLAFITMAVVGMVLLRRARRRCPLEDRPLGPAFIAVGLGILGLFYTADLFVMFLLPGVVGRAQSMVAMEQLHLNYSWIAFLTSGISVTAGAALTFRTVGHTSAERTRTEENLRESEERFRVLADAPFEGIVMAEAGRVLDCNQQIAELWGYNRSELIGMEVLDLVALESRDLVREHVQAGDTEPYCSRGLRKDGTTFTVEVRGRSIPFCGRSVRVTALRDMTQWEEAQRQLSESEVRYRRLIEDQTEFIVKWLPDGTRTFVNDSYCRYFEQSRDDILGTSFMPLIAEEDRSAVRNRLDSLTPEAPVSSAEHRVVRPDGSVGWQEWTDRAFFDSAGTIVELQSVGRDITEKKQADDALRTALEELQVLRDRLEAENLYLREEIKLDHDFEHIVGESETLRRALGKVEQVAPTDSTVLLLGETGTGKELFARAIHGLSRRAGRPLVKVDCAALPATLIESELFGHEKGAFTGALRQKSGRFELADGGTLFLDEVGDLPLEVQGKLLRALQDGEFERVGGTEQIHVDVRVVAATNRDLERATEAEEFRADLYYRLNVFPVRLPPLRERPEDIPLLAEHFASKHAKRIGKSIESISGRTLHSLATYPWPGNVRELENRIERALISTQGPVLDMPSLTNEVGVAEAARTLREVESQHIREVLESVGWVIEGDAGAASTLGIASSTLRSRMRKLEITRPRRSADPLRLEDSA